MSDARKDQVIHGEITGNESTKKTDYKLLIDPQLRRGEEKLIRYDGESYNTENHGQGVVILRDPRPRMNRLWSRREKADLSVPRYKVDEWYIGAVPPREVTFSKLNDNVTRQFMEKMCSKYGKLERVRVYHHPKTQKHMGLSKVVFTSMKAAAECVKKLHMTSIMGNVINVQIDSKGEILNKLFQRIARGEMVAETIPDVIRHTQDGISMSNKYKERHAAKRESRKSSQDDPRRRKSSDSRDKSHSHHHEASGMKRGDRKNSRQGEGYDKGNGTTLTSLEEEDLICDDNSAPHDLTSDSEESHPRSTDLEARISSLLHGDIKVVKSEQQDNNSNDFEQRSREGDDGLGVGLRKNFSLDSMDSSVLGSTQSEESLQNIAKDQPFTGEHKELNVDRGKLSVSNSASPSHTRIEHSVERILGSPSRLDQGDKHAGLNSGFPPHGRSDHPCDRYSPRHFDRSPPYNHRSHHPRSPDPDFGPPPHDRNFHSPRRSPGFGRERRWKQVFSGRPDFEHDRRHFLYENDERNRRDFHYRRRDVSPPRRPLSPRGRRMRSPNNWPPPDRFSTHHLPPHHRRHSPSRFDHRHGSLTREISPPRFRRSRSPDSRKKIRKDYKYQRRSPSPGKGLVFDDGQRTLSPRNLRKSESPKLSLDQRLKEMTGEPQGAPCVPGRMKRKKKDQDESSVDMEISEGDSDNEKSDRAIGSYLPSDEHQRNSGVLQDPPAGQKKWNFDPELWNGFRPRGHVPIVPEMWNLIQPNVFKGYENGPRPPGQFTVRYQQDRWPSQFHSGGPGGLGPPSAFHFGPGGPFPIGQRMPFQDKLGCVGIGQENPLKLEDERLCGCVLDDVVQDLKAIVSRDLNRKVVETMAFKVYESWWDENSNKKLGSRIPLVASNPDLNAQNNKTVAANEKANTDEKSDVKKPNQSMLNAFDPLNWAKNSFEMDGFRIGLGLRSAISKMPSFRVKKRPRTPTPPREEESEEATRNRKARRAIGKENQAQAGKRFKEKKYNRIAALDSGGEDEEEQSEVDHSDGESSSEQHSKRKMGVLDVDEVFSESSESDYDSSSESEKSEEESSGEESETEEENTAESSVQHAEEEDDKQSARVALEAMEFTSDSAMITDKSIEKEDEKQGKEQSPTPSEVRRTSADSDTTYLSEDPNIATSLLSPTALGVTPTSITPQQLRHIHPKKRHRLLSHDQYEPYAKVANIPKPKEELSLITEKERVVLEALADMQCTPDRRSSQDSDISTLSQVSHSDNKSPVRRILSDSNETQPCSSPQEELDAVEALLSIKKSAPLLSNITPEKSPQITVQKHEGKLPPLLLGDWVKMAELAEEHNYFAPTFGPSRPHPTLDPAVSQILEEHNYCHPGTDRMASDIQIRKDIPSSQSLSTLSAESIYNFEDEPSEVISAAERVKLRHVKPKKKITPKKHKKEVQELKFKERSKTEDLIITYDMWCNGLDLEDMKFLRDVYETYLEKSKSPSWVNDSHWVPHPITAIAAPTKQKRRKTRSKPRSNETQEPHFSGSARTEGFYKMEDMVKLRQRREMYGQGDSQTSIKVDNSNSSNASELTSGNQAAIDKNLGTREKRHFMRRIAAEVGSDAGDLLKYNQLMFRKKAVKFKKSSIHGWGLFAEEPIAADEMVIEYVGQVVRTQVAERREVNYTKLGIGSSYLFRIDTEHIIDATKCGNYARFMNHSCNPSCYAKVITVDTAKKIVIYSKGPIKKSEEITYDYKFPLEDDKVMCFCGAENCRRTLN